MPETTLNRHPHAVLRAEGLCPCGHVLDRSTDYDCRHCMRLASHRVGCKAFGACEDCNAWDRRELRRDAHAARAKVPGCSCVVCATPAKGA